MQKVRVGILRGGANENYETSLREGSKMISYITENLPNKCIPLDIFVDKDGVWHLQGIPIVPFDLIHKVDVVWDTTVPAMSQVLEGHISLFKVPNFAWSMANSKALLREHMKTIDVQMPMHILMPPYQEDFDGPLDSYAVKKAREVHAKFGAPWIVKSFTRNPDVGVHTAKTFPALIDAIEDLSQHKESILVEELIPGKRGGVHTIPGFRGEDLYHMLPYEIRKNGALEPIGNFNDTENKKLYALSENIYHHLGAENYLHFNFVLNKRGAIYVTDIMLVPDFTDGGGFARSSKTVGSNSQEVFQHLLDRALVKR
ncbi:MAG: hypothetical protein M3Q34_01045 [bacterium]|nr:hypothetical protein [bacterium]